MTWFWGWGHAMCHVPCASQCYANGCDVAYWLPCFCSSYNANTSELTGTMQRVHENLRIEASKVRDTSDYVPHSKKWGSCSPSPRVAPLRADLPSSALAVFTRMIIIIIVIVTSSSSRAPRCQSVTRTSCLLLVDVARDHDK